MHSKRGFQLPIGSSDTKTLIFHNFLGTLTGERRKWWL